MALNPTGIRSWNYSNRERDGYSEQLIGTVVALQEVQAREFNLAQDGTLGKARFWDNGRPVMNIRMSLAQPDGSLITWTFPQAGKEQKARRKPSVHMQLWDITGDKSMTDLIGKTLQITTWSVNPTTGQPWQRGNPRLFDVQEIQAGPYQLNSPLPPELEVPELLANDGATGGQPVQQQPPLYQQYQQQQQYQAAPPIVNGMFAPPTAVPQQPQVQQMPAQVAPQYQYPTNMSQQPMTVPVQQAPMMTPSVQSAPMPAGMDPAIAATMQTLGATNVQPVPYDEDIPF